MPDCFKKLKTKKKYKAFKKMFQPVVNSSDQVTPLISKGNRDLEMTFQDQLAALVLYHLEEYKSGRHLLQALQEDNFAKSIIASTGLKRSTFFEVINYRGLEQLIETFNSLYKEAASKLPDKFSGLGDLVAIDGSLIDATLSMHWADYRKHSNKAKTHMGFDINRGIPKNLYISDGKADERPYVGKILEPGQTGIMDRYYQYHKNFDTWQGECKHFVCRIKTKTTKTLLITNEIKAGSIVFYDAVVLLGTPGATQTEKPVRVVGYKVRGVEYWIATDRFDLTAEEIAQIYKLRWDIEIFFGWWKNHLKVYHIIARSKYGLMVQIFSGLITYLLLAIYCRDEYNEEVSIKRVRELRFQIRNEFSSNDDDIDDDSLKKSDT